MHAIFLNQQFSAFVPGPGSPVSVPTDAQHVVALSEANLLRLRTIYRSGFEAQALLTEAGLVVTPTEIRRSVVVPLVIRQEEGGGRATVRDLHRLSEEAAGELVADELETSTAGRVKLTAAQGEVRAMQAVLESFQGLWTVAHVDMREALAEGLRAALLALKERGVTKLVEQAVLSATKERTAQLA